MTRRAWIDQVMGLPVSVHVRGPDLHSKHVERQVAAVFAHLRHVDAVLSPYRDDSDLSRWERGDLTLDAADPMLPQVIQLCDDARTRTDGWFDPRRLPDPRTGAPRYDPSGLVKGWAVREAADHLTDLAGYGWCLNAGGDVLVHAPDGQPPWRIGIEDPDDPARILRVVTRDGGAVATSGGAHRGTHIVDPNTGRPATAVRAVTVTGPDLMWADVYATAAVAEGAHALDRLDEQDGYEALLVSASGLVRVTGNWPVPG
ncbi:FAD:protein FMN transferase [Virgisporangium aurantiacum]|uniref:FAD:protein FMN transferase n=1 Tax=Virgisporangium aurantiacum TaxID=175570 RepID=A0A8J3ZE18_9ACTN|nr:FAD:protein FMN transferase [Virgisporangium aurantiacum]GIJ61083.1 FAD:protein FMN transferase [Virgisporangium aurantiacum]